MSRVTRCLTLLVCIVPQLLAASPRELSAFSPEVQSAAKPEYPLEARRHNMQGRGVFWMHLRPDGTVARVEIRKSIGYRILDKAAVAALSQWRFRPGVF